MMQLSQNGFNYRDGLFLLPILVRLRAYFESLILLMRSQSSINIAVTMKLSLQLVLLRAKKSFPHFIGYQNFQNDLTKLVSSQTLAVLTSCLTAIKNHWIKYCEKTYEREGINYFGL